jgi:hypothetical protein
MATRMKRMRRIKADFFCFKEKIGYDVNVAFWGGLERILFL